VKFKLLLSSLAVLALFAQMPAPELPSNSRPVEISVIVHDKSGPVHGLTAADFKIFEKGKEVPIASFQPADAPSSAQAALPANLFHNRPDAGTASGVTIILLDSLNTAAQSQSYIHKQFAAILATLKPTDRVAVFVLGSELRLLYDVGPRNIEGEPTLDETLNQIGIATGVDQQEQLVATTAALVAVANHVSRMPGRKNLVWVSGGFPVALDHDGAEGPPGWDERAPNTRTGNDGTLANGAPLDRRTFRKTFKPAMDALTFANITLYEADARGLVDAPDAVAAPAGRSRTRASAEAAGTLAAAPRTGVLRPVVEDTSGRIFESENDVRKSARVALADAEASYTLTFYPDAKSFDSRFHDLKVQLDRKDLDIRYRKGYLAIPETKPSDSQVTDNIRQALHSPVSTDTIGLIAASGRVDTPKPGSLRTRVAITGTDVLLQPNGNQWTGTLDLVFSTRGADGKERSTTRSSIALKLDKAQYDGALKQGLSLDKTIDAAPDVTELRVVVADHLTGRVGSLIVPVEKP
jgi:VWFA-related protein